MQKKIEVKCRGAELADIDQLQPLQGNLKDLTTENYNKLKKEILELGFSEPFSVWRHEGKLNVLNGHQRLRVLKQLREKEGYDVPKVPINTVEAKDLAEAQRKILALTSNYGSITRDGLYEFATQAHITLEEMTNSFTFPEIDFLTFAQEYYTEPARATDDVPGSSGKLTITKPGNLWTMGPHRLLCGDATQEKDMERLMAGEKASMIFTDPPYGVDYTARSGKHAVLQGDEKKQDDLVKNLLAPAFRLMTRHSKATAGIYIWHASSTREEFTFAMKAAGIAEKQTIIWAKPTFVMGWSDYRWSHEPCFYCSKAGQTPDFYADRSEPTVWRVGFDRSKEGQVTIEPGLVITDGQGHQLFIQSKAPKGKKLRFFRLQDPKDTLALQSEEANQTMWEVSRDHGAGTDHPTQKPVELAKRAIENSSRPGDIVLDPFLGSGTTIIGAELTGRKGYGLELSPAYCDVIVARWEKITGKKAVLEQGGALTQGTKQSSKRAQRRTEKER